MSREDGSESHIIFMHNDAMSSEEREAREETYFIYKFMGVECKERKL